jgi:competence ComEA-like helix-hairpin-helix protein
MKKSIILVLITMTLVFASYVGGFYVGRNQSLGSIQILGLLPESTQPVNAFVHTAFPATTAILATPGGSVTSSHESSTFPSVPVTNPVPTQPVIGTSPTEPAIVSTTPKPTETTPSVGSGLININTAGLDLLDTLPGIGPKLAQAIIDYRNEYGPFEKPEDIVNVPGIGEKKLAAIIDLITTGG